MKTSAILTNYVLVNHFININIYTGVSISNRTDYFFSCSLMHRKLGLIFLPHILDEIGRRCYEAKMSRCSSLLQNVEVLDNREKEAHLKLKGTSSFSGFLPNKSVKIYENFRIDTTR